MDVLNTTELDAIRHLTRSVRTAEAYRRITEDVFIDGVMSWGRIFVWHAFSCEFYDLLAPRERSRVNQFISGNGGHFFYMASGLLDYSCRC